MDKTQESPENNWQSWKDCVPAMVPLFVTDLDSDELDLVDAFYDSCSLAQAEIQRLNNYLPLSVEEKVKITQHKIMELAEKYKDQSNNLSNDSVYLERTGGSLKNIF